MFSEKRPKLGDQVIYWTPGEQAEDPPVPNIAIVCNVANEGEIEWRPYLNLTVFRANDGKPWARLSVPTVFDDGGQVIFAHKYTLPGEYPNDGTQ